MLTVEGGTGAIIEYHGPGADSISATGKGTICNMGAEIGATTSLFPYDANMAPVPQGHRPRGHRRRRRQGRRRAAARRRRVLRPAHRDRPRRAEAADQRPALPRPRPPRRRRGRRGRRRERLAAGDLLGADRLVHELVVRGHHPGRVDRPPGVGQGPDGRRSSCWSRRAPSRSGRRSSATACSPTSRPSAPPCWPTPAVRASGSGRGPESITGQPNTIVNSYNRNFPKRNDGSANTLSFVTSPDTVMALALAGRLDFDPTTDTLTAPDGTEVTLDPPVGEVLPDRGYDPGEDTFTAPPDDGSRRRGRGQPDERPPAAARAVPGVGRQRLPRACRC